MSPEKTWLRSIINPLMQMNLNIYETIYRNKFSIIIFTWTILLVFSMLVPAANFVMK
jgi:hypothetical protein